MTSKTWKGDWQGIEVDVEVLTVKTADGQGTEFFTEFSFKTAAEADAKSLREKALAVLDGSGWLDKNGDLKTSLILDRY